ncbi:MAG: nitroreductase family protein, partial [Mariprofundaceae bacterium]|nr:nitroreductase family protein [Mariprofundaceae bacterium]
MASIEFSQEESDIIYRVIHARRDMRHFVGGEVEVEALARILKAAHAAPSVGYMQPWRFVRITKSELRESLIALVEAEKQRTSDDMD